ncbi:hypothetical protein HDU91_003257 [Kappamyces sp. JEL0680]|nr:hypothetical protein HDU91_003257 [Kappamyces sp. JEL0680]
MSMAGYLREKYATTPSRNLANMAIMDFSGSFQCGDPIFPTTTTNTVGPVSGNPTLQVSQFIATTVYYLVYSYSADQSHPTVQAFQSFISTILACTTNNVTAPVILTSLLYVSRYVQNTKFYGPIQQGSEVKIWVTALMLADAVINDAAYAVKSWSDVTKIPVQECIKMRQVFLEIISYDLHVSEVQYDAWINSLQQISAHVSSILFYKSTMNGPAMNLISQPLMRQVYPPGDRLSPVFLSVVPRQTPTFEPLPSPSYSPSSNYPYLSLASPSMYYSPPKPTLNYRLSWA